jgi:hypothetical protein
MNQGALLIDVMSRLTYLRRLSKTALAAFRVTDNPKQRVRCSEVAAHVAEVLEKENSPALRADLRHALEALGWRSVNTDNVRRWKGVVTR